MKSCSQNLWSVADSFLNVDDEEMMERLGGWLGTLLAGLMDWARGCKDVDRKWKSVGRCLGELLGKTRDT